MIPMSIHLKGFGCFRDTRIEFKRPIVCFVGPFGSGKTFLIEATHAALYGEFPFMGGHLYRHVTQGGDGRAMVSAVVAHDGRAYEITREIDAPAKKHSVMVTDVATGEQMCSASPTAAQNWIDAKFGSAMIARATQQAVQGAKGDLTEIEASKRRELFIRHLGIAHLPEMAKRLRESARQISRTVDRLDGQLTSVPDTEAGLESARGDLAMAQLKASEEEKALYIARAELQSARDEQGMVESEYAEISRQRSERDRVESQRTRLATAVKVATDRLGIARQTASGYAGFAGIEVQLDEARQELAAMQRYADFRQLLSTWETTDGRLEAAVHTIAARIDTLRAQTSVSEEDERLAGQLAEREKNYRDAERANLDNQQARLTHQRTAESASSTVRNLNQRIEELQGQINRQQELPFGEKCVTARCQFVAEYATLPEKLRAAIAQRDTAIDDHAKAAAALESIPGDIDLTPLIERGRDARMASQRLSRVATALDAVKAETAKLDEAKRQLSLHRKPGKPAWDGQAFENVTALIEAQRPSIRALEDQLANANRARVAHESLGRHEAELNSAEDDLAAFNATHPPAETIDSAELDRRRAEINDRVAQATSKLAELTSAESRSRAAIAAAEARITMYEKTLASMSEAKEERAKADRSRANRERLAAIFAPAGAPALVLEAAKGPLEAMVDDVLSAITGGMFKFSIQTQKAMSDGSVGEDFEFIVHGPGGAREFERYSGGQRAVIRFAFRIAMSLWAQRYHGRETRFIALDEAMDGMGQDAGLVLDYLRSTTSRLQRILITSHDSHIQSDSDVQAIDVRTLPGWFNAGCGGVR